MEKKKLLRRVGILCCHCLRNLAYYRAGKDRQRSLFRGDFQTTVNGNFLDICVLEWCKLFSDTHGTHYWGNVITDKECFEADLTKLLKQLSCDFNDYDKKEFFSA